MIDESLFENLYQKEKLKKTKDAKSQKHNTPPVGKRKSEASFGSLILLYRSQWSLLET
jgi:hypothetical protein